MSDTTDIQKQTAGLVLEFVRLLDGATEMAVQACYKYVEAIDADPGAHDEFRRVRPLIPEGTWAMFEKVGRKQWHERFLYGVGQVDTQIRRLPYSQQTQVIEKGVDVLLPQGDVLHVTAETMTPDQGRQVMARDHIRTPAEQKAYVEDVKARAAIVDMPKRPVSDPWEIRRGRIIIREAISVDSKTVAQWLAEMTR